jgi:hypothetical protein
VVPLPCCLACRRLSVSCTVASLANNLVATKTSLVVVGSVRRSAGVLRASCVP